MGRTPSRIPAARAARRPASAWRVAVLALVSATLGSGCAMLIPPSWRAHAPVPLAGPIPALNPEASAEATEWASLSNEQLLRLVQADHDRLVEIASAEAAGPHATPESEAELRAIADRLPALQAELVARGAGGPGSRTRHPVIR